MPEAAEGARRTPGFISDGDDDVFCFPLRKLWTLLLLCLNSTKNCSNFPDGDPATCDEDHTDFG